MWPFTLAFRSSAPLMAFERGGTEPAIRGDTCQFAAFRWARMQACMQAELYAQSGKLCSSGIGNAHWWHDCYAQDAGQGPAALGGGEQRREGRRLRFGLTLGEIGGKSECGGRRFGRNRTRRTS